MALNRRITEVLSDRLPETQEYLNKRAFIIYLSSFSEIQTENIIFACKTWILNNRFSSTPENKKEKSARA